MPGKEVGECAASSSFSIDRLAPIVLGQNANYYDCPPLEFLALMAPVFPRTGLLFFETRLKRLLPWGSTFAEMAAGEGFALNLPLTASSHLSVKCVSCGAVCSIPDPSSPNFLHHLGCQFNRVSALCSSRAASPIAKDMLRLRRFRTYLRGELKTTKTRVALDFGFDEDLICMALAKQFFVSGRPFANAGLLVDFLTEFCLEEKQKLELGIEGVARIVKQAPPDPRSSPVKGTGETFDQ